MRFQILTLGAIAAVASAAAKPGLPKPDKDGRYTISAPGITAKVMLYSHLYRPSACFLDLAHNTTVPETNNLDSSSLTPPP
ncbi:hypothetical protein V490_02880 [Pseudogymnoascus sp. VKM F-3557]|nr:hypothetical protein V490_02880 [Pseudogymnoascus sp. VKM F-3557]